jgi:hypothetical protein
MLYKKVNPWFGSALSVSTANQQIPHRQREHRNTFSTEALNSPYEVAAGIFLYRNGLCALLYVAFDFGLSLILFSLIFAWYIVGILYFVGI